MKQIKFLLFLFCTFFIFSCSDEDPTTGENTISFPMTVDDYWIYERSEDQSGNIVTNLDTTRIVGTETIGNHQYFQFESTNGAIQNYLVRDSSDYLVNEKGAIIFSFDENYDGISTELIPEVNPRYQIDNKMLSGLSSLVVQAGTFDVKTYETTLIDLQVDGQDPKVGKLQYTKDVGMVFQRYYYASSATPVDVELVEYNIQ